MTEVRRHALKPAERIVDTWREINNSEIAHEEFLKRERALLGRTYRSVKLPTPLRQKCVCGLSKSAFRSTAEFNDHRVVCDAST